MKVLGVLLQTKKGDPVIISSAPSLHTRTIILYSNLIYANILDSYRRRERFDRCVVLENNLHCVVNIAKDYIFYVYVNKCELGLAFDAVKKVSQYLNNNSLKIFEGAKTGQGKLEVIGKRFVEFMSFFEQFLYTREFPTARDRQLFSLNSPIESNKKKIGFEIFNKFSHITQENDKVIILEMSKASNKVAGLEVKKKMKTIEHMKKFSLKNKDEIELLEVIKNQLKTDPQKDDFLAQYRKNIAKFAYCGRHVTNNHGLYHQSKQRVINQKVMISESNFIIEEQVLDESPMIERERIKLKIMEKLELHLFQGKIKQVIQFGQVIVEGTQPQTAVINLLNPEQYWANPKVLNKRISPNSLSIKELNPTRYEFTTALDYKSKPVIDYIIRKETFTPEKIPLLFVYTMETSSSNIEFVFKYKINQKWKQPLTQIEIAVHLNPDFVIRQQVKSIPMAVSLKNHKIIWKTKQISSTNSSKGKILLAFTSSNVPSKKIIKEIRLNMKCHHKGMLDGLMAECRQDDGQKGEGEKTLIINYKVHPNQ